MEFYVFYWVFTRLKKHSSKFRDGILILKLSIFRSPTLQSSKFFLLLYYSQFDFHFLLDLDDLKSQKLWYNLQNQVMVGCKEKSWVVKFMVSFVMKIEQFYFNKFDGTYENALNLNEDIQKECKVRQNLSTVDS